MTSLPVQLPAVEQWGVLSRFRMDFYECLYTRADVLFELTDPLLCTDGPVRTLVDLSLAAEHRRGHGAMYAALDRGWLEPARLRRALAALPLPRLADGRIALAVDVSNWLRPDAPTSDDRLFCHVYGRGRSADQLIPGWPYSFVAALETGRTSWTALLDAVRLGPADDATAVTGPGGRLGRRGTPGAAGPDSGSCGAGEGTGAARGSGARAAAGRHRVVRRGERGGVGGSVRGRPHPRRLALTVRSAAPVSGRPR
ncbi:hypothetical protein GCM10010440_75030 [Kitasatospora cinereorecta]